MDCLHIYPTQILLSHRTTAVDSINSLDSPKPLRIVDIMELIENDDPDKDLYIVVNNNKSYY